MHMFSFSIGSMYRMNIYRANQGNKKSIPSDGSKGKSIPFLFQLPEDVGIYSLSATSLQSPLPSSCCIFHFWVLLCLSCSDPCDYTRSTWIIQEYLPFSRSLTWEHLQSPFFQIRQHLQILGIRIWTSLGVYSTTVFIPPFLSFFLTVFLLYF